MVFLNAMQDLEIVFMCSFQQYMPCLVVLYQAKVWMKLKENIVIKSKLMDKKQVFSDGRNMKNVFKDKTFRLR